MKITVTGASQTSTALRDLPDNLAREVIRQMAAIVYDGAEDGARSHSRPGGTGALLQSLYNRQQTDGISRAVGHDTARAPYAKFVLFGARPHEIRPKNKKALRWAGPGGWIFAAKVNHPGYRGDPYLTRAADAAIAQFSTIVDNAMKRSI